MSRFSAKKVLDRLVVSGPKLTYMKNEGRLGQSKETRFLLTYVPMICTITTSPILPNFTLNYLSFSCFNRQIQSIKSSVQRFHLCLIPPRLNDNPIDSFVLFSTRHFASSCWHDAQSDNCPNLSLLFPDVSVLRPRRMRPWQRVSKPPDLARNQR